MQLTPDKLEETSTNTLPLWLFSICGNNMNFYFLHFHLEIFPPFLKVNGNMPGDPEKMGKL